MGKLHASLLLLSVFSLPLCAAISQTDLAGHWSGTLTDSAGQTVYALDFTVDSKGTLTGTGDARPLAASTLTSNGAPGTAGGFIHWFYVDTGVNFDLSAGVPVTAAGGTLKIKGAVDGQFYVAPMPPHSSGKWTLDISGGMGGGATGSISFSVKAGSESKSSLMASISIAGVVGILPKGPSGKPTLKTLQSLTLSLGSASFPLAVMPPHPQAGLVKNNLVLKVRGLNLIELLSIDPNAPAQTATTTVTLTGVDSGGNTITFFNSPVGFAVTIHNGLAKGMRNGN